MRDEDKLTLILREVKEIKAEVKTLDDRMDGIEKKYVEAASYIKAFKWFGVGVIAVATLGMEGLLKLKWW